MRTYHLPSISGRLTFLLLGLAIATSTGLAADRTLIRAKALYPGDGPVVAPAAILIEKGRISRIATSIKVDENVQVADYPEGVLLPGFIDTYSHLGVAGGRAEVTREVTPDFRVVEAIDWQAREFRRAASNGTTSAVVAPGTDSVFAGIGIVAKTAGTTESRILRSDVGDFITMASDARSRNRSRIRPDSIYVRQPTNRMGIVWILRSTLDRARRATPDSHPRLRAVLAGEHSLFVVSRTDFDIESVLRLSDEFDLSPILVGGREAFRMADQLAERKIPVILDPISTGDRSGPEGTRPAWNRAGILHEAGVEIALSGEHLLEQARFAVRFGLPQDAALRSITVTPARLLGVADRVGRLEAGLDADLVVLNGDPFAFTSAIEAVYVSGELQP